MDHCVEHPIAAFVAMNSIETTAMSNELRATELDRPHLASGYLLNSSAIAIVSMFTTIGYTYMSNGFPSSKRRLAAINALCVTALIFQAIDQFVNSRVCLAIWKNSRPWCKIVLHSTSFIRSLAVFVSLHFVSVEVSAVWKRFAMSTLETMLAIFIGMLFIHAMLDLMNRVVTAT